MQATIANSVSSTESDSALLAQIASLRESLKGHRSRARELWDACAPESVGNAGEARLALGQYTAKYLKGQTDAAFA